MAYIAHLGGLIRHPELDPNFKPPMQATAVGNPAAQQMPPEMAAPKKDDDD
jgi:hypothetical protein